MPVTEMALCQVATEIWGSILGLELLQRNDDTPAVVDEHTLTGCIQITGAWEGAVTLDCPTAFARRATALLLGMESDDLELADIQDAIGELANILGGNVKALLPSPCEISLPAVTEGSDYRIRFPGSQLASQARFDCEGYPVAVSLLQRDAERSARM